MSHSFCKILIHAIWSTKERQPLILLEHEKAIHNYMAMQFKNLECNVLTINGMPDHVHCLFLQDTKKSIADVVKQVKGATSHFINQQNLSMGKFAWQSGFAAFSVSESVRSKVFSYIQNQKVHHAKHSFQEEYEDFLRLHHL